MSDDVDGVIEPETINHRRVMATNISRSLFPWVGYGKEGKGKEERPIRVWVKAGH